MEEVWSYNSTVIKIKFYCWYFYSAPGVIMKPKAHSVTELSAKGLCIL